MRERGGRRSGSRGRGLGAAAVVAVSALLAAACSDDEPSATTTTTTVGDDTTSTAPGGTAAGGLPEGVQVLDAGDDLYALADDIEPGEPGAPIAIQPVDSDLDASVWRVLHHSESLEGDDIAVSGLIAVPNGEAPTEGRPVLSWAHGTTGIADECAPSTTLGQLVAAAPLLDRGMVVVATDYEGLGTPGRHPYLVGESQGRGVLDIVRAARALGATVGAGEQVVLWGHSQGGHAVLFANQIAPQWAPELDVVGTVAGAPPSQLPLMAEFVGDGPGSFFLAMVIAGWAAAYPEADPADVLTPAGLERLGSVDEGCLGDVADAWSAPTEGDLVRPEGAQEEPWVSLFVENDPGYVVGASPVLVIHGDQDEVVPVATSALLVDRMCEVGQPVRRLVFADASHVSVVASSLSDMLEWIDARLVGQPAPDDCDARDN